MFYQLSWSLLTHELQELQENLTLPILNDWRENLKNMTLFKAHSEWNEKTQVNILKVLSSIWGMRERKKDGDVQVIASTEYSTPLSNIRHGRALLVCFQGTSAIPIFEFVLCRGGQMQEKTCTFWPSQEYLQVLPLPKRAKPPANHSFKNVWQKQCFYESTLKIDLKSWT